MEWAVAALTAVVIGWLIYTSRVRSAMRASVLQGFYEAYSEFNDGWDEKNLREMGPRMLYRSIGHRLLNSKTSAWWWEGRALAAFMRAEESSSNTLIHPQADQVLALHRSVLSEQAKKQVAILMAAREQSNRTGADFNTILRNVAENLAENGRN